MSKIQYLWKDRKRGFLGLPWTFTRYRLTEDKLIIDTGFLTRAEDEIRLYRILDISLRRTLGERILGLGTIHCCSSDKTSPEFDIKRIKKPKQVKEQLSDLIEKERLNRRVGLHEFVDQNEGDGMGFPDHDDDEHGISK